MKSQTGSRDTQPVTFTAEGVRDAAIRSRPAPSKFMCRYCGAIFDKEEISRPMKNQGRGILGDWVWMDDQCPKCKKGLDNWYIPTRYILGMHFKEILQRAIRYQRDAE